MTMGKLFDKLLNRKKERHPRCAALVPAAGRSERMGGTDKLTAPLCGVPVLARTLTALDQAVLVDEIVVAVQPEKLEEVAALVSRAGIRKPIRVVEGGANRAESVLLAALGRYLTEGGDVFAYAAALAAELTPPRDTHGAEVARRHQVGGARAEALAGFPTARKAAELLQTHDPLTALLWLMAHTEDTNLYHRGGVEGAVFVKEQAAAILAAPPEQRTALMQVLDDALIDRWLSPGGSADLLALALLLSSSSTVFPSFDR